ncbi:translocation/assembly module TamB domain-containing protein [Arcobacter cryaerophilus gv. pseudocryaerophilus]|uniref:Translocation/assembly module TamB domain-containing protein n=3 Tax=Arcobacteraceae TaxID=2808963 RepID=A0AA96DWD3_9BACT|nr:translocation/assembly module TamB domain-containing protein [Arcobacter sp. AZ-2023]WNL35663.1 translocation/assembly module TamB domain-containing protein [Arcobacter sp. AZ-2023]WPD11379.1 translocation/assembly module TamB domain-containing protein [Arcobacter sp. DSM 115960]
MIILRALKYLFFTIIALCLVTFLYLITSKDVTQKIFNYLSVEFPIKYSKVDGSIYEGIKIYDLSYDDIIKSKTVYIKPNIISLLVKEINLSDLKIENITIEDKLISFIKESNETQNENSSFEFPFSLVIKNLELSMYNFSYENQKIDEIVLNAKNINSNLKDKISADIFTKIKSNLANLEANMQIENNIYKLNSNIDLKEYAKSKINLDATGDLEKVSFSIKSDDLKVLNLKENIEIKDIKLIGNYDIKNSNLDISSLTSNLNYEQIFTKLDAKANLLNNDLDSLKFQANFYTTIKKSIYKSLDKDLNIKSNFIGDLKQIEFKNILEANLVKIDDFLLKIDSSNLNGVAKIDNKNIEIISTFDIFTNYANKKSNLDLKLNLDDLENLSLNSKSVIESLKYENFNLKELGNININSSYKKNFLNMDLNSKYINMNLNTKNLKKIMFDFNIKNLNPNNIYKLDNNIKISKISSNIKGEFEDNLTLKSNTILNDSFNIDVELKNKKSNLEAKFENVSFKSILNKNGEVLNIKTEIRELNIFEKELKKIFEIPDLNLFGFANINLEILKNRVNFDILSPKISFLNQNIENIDIKGNFEEERVLFDKIDFHINKIYDINFNKKFTLLKKAFFNVSNFSSNFEFENITINSSKDKKDLILNITTKDFFIEHLLYGKGFINSSVDINISENSKIYISGFVNPNKLVSSYNIPALNISNDRDIIIVNSGDNEMKKDFFTKNIELDLKIISKEIKYITKNIELKLDADLQIKKEFEEDLRIFGRVSNINGVFSQLGKTYKIENSNLQFRGLETINPILDIKANTKIDNVEIFIDITGNIENPRLNLKSNPSMNSKDILSYLIFGTKFSNSSMNEQNKEAQASLFILNELSKDYVKELGIDILHFDYDPKTQYIETTFGKKIGEKNQIIIKNKATNGELIFLRELTKLWNLELGLMEKTQSIDLIYKKRY